jgi:plastocyanin
MLLKILPVNTRKFSGLLVVAVLSLGLGIARPIARAASPNGFQDSQGGAVIKGVVKVQGTVPKPAHIDMSADPFCAKAHPSGATAENIVTDGQGQLENAIVYVSGGLEGKTFDLPQTPVVIEQKDCMYKPHIVTMRASQKLQIVNDDKTTHNIHPEPNNNREFNKSQPPGVPMEDTFTREEVAIRVKCNVHPWMRSYIAVFKHPFYSVSGKGGGFELKNLPPGTYTVTAWQEDLGTQVQKVTVGASETKTVEFVFRAPGS